MGEPLQNPKQVKQQSDAKALEGGTAQIGVPGWNAAVMSSSKLAGAYGTEGDMCAGYVLPHDYVTSTAGQDVVAAGQQQKVVRMMQYTDAGVEGRVSSTPINSTEAIRRLLAFSAPVAGTEASARCYGTAASDDAVSASSVPAAASSAVATQSMCLNASARQAATARACHP
eukprot:gene10012-10166_t